MNENINNPIILHLHGGPANPDSFLTYEFAKEIIAGNHVDIGDIVLSGFAIAACYVPVYFNLIMDKIKEIKLGGKNDWKCFD